MNAQALAFRQLVNELREERAAALETFVGPDQPIDDSPKDPFRDLTYSEMNTVCGCGRKQLGACAICTQENDREQRQRRIGP